jgi:hypothetical protein
MNPPHVLRPSVAGIPAAVSAKFLLLLAVVPCSCLGSLQKLKLLFADERTGHFSAGKLQWARKVYAAAAEK